MSKVEMKRRNREAYMKRIIILALIMVFAIGIGCTREVEEYAMVTFAVGNVTKNDVSVNIGDLLKEKDIVKTDELSSCDIKIGDSMIRIKENSKLLVSQIMRSQDLENTVLGLDVGKMLCKPKKLLKNEKFLVKTPTAVAGVRGTKFTVEADSKKTTRIKVYDGKVNVARRIASIEEQLENVMNEAPPIEQNQKVIITEKEVQDIEKKVEKLMKSKPADEAAEVAVVRIVQDVKNDVIVSKKEIKSFQVEDFKEEQKEIIAVEEKPKEVIKKITRIVKEEKEKPVPEGQLLVTRYEVYFIKNGKVQWEGKVIEPPVKTEDKLYIASGEYVYCASLEGPVLWRKKIENNGELELSEEALIVNSQTGKKKLDLETGTEI